MATPGANIDRDKDDHSFSNSITTQEEEYTDQDPVSVVTDQQFMPDLRMKLNKQDGQLGQLQKSLFGVEERISARLDKEKEYLRERLSESMKLILEKLAPPQLDSKLNPSIEEHPVSCSQSYGHQSSQQTDRSDDLTKSDSELTDLISLVTSMNRTLRDIQENELNGLASTVTDGFNGLREARISIIEEERKLQLEERDVLKTRHHNTLTDVKTESQESSSELKDVLFTSLSEQTNLLREETLHKFDEQKQFLVTEMNMLRKEISQSNTSVLKGVQFSLTLFLLCFMGNCAIWISLSPTHAGTHQMFNVNDNGASKHLNNILTLQAIDLSWEHIRHELTSLSDNITTTMDYSITLANDELMKRIDKSQHDIKAVTNKLKTDTLKESNQTTSNDTDKWKTDFIAEVKSSIDKQVISTMQGLENNMDLKLDQQLLYLNRDLADVIEKEAQITREYVVDHVEQRKVYEFIFRVRRFQDRVGSGLEVLSIPWYVPQFETSLKGLVRFLADGQIYIRLVYGRYPKIVGLQPKPKKSFFAEVRVIDEANTGKSGPLSSFRAQLDEQTATSDSWGWDVGKLSSDELLQQGFVKYDTLVIKYIIKL